MTPVARSGISRLWPETLGTHEAHHAGRHAQASFLEADYDKLCAKGDTQARLLGKFWLGRGVIFQKAYSGPRVGQRETSRIVAEVYRAGGHSFPEIEVMS